MTTETNHAEANAKAWLESICEMIAALKAFDDEEGSYCDEKNKCPACLADEGERCRDFPKIDGDVMDSRDDVEQRIAESPLSVQVRGGWHNVGEEAEDEEFEILLSTGGPALRIIGELGEHNNPERPRLQYQDWGTPWTEYIVTGEDREALEAFCEQFYFGD